MTETTAHDRRQRRTLIGLALFFFAPLAVSFYLYYAGDWRPGHRVNRGELITPARPLPRVALSLAHTTDHTSPALLEGKWTLLYWGPGSCDTRCHTNLYNMRQVRLALNRDMERVQRVFIADGECCDWQYLETQQQGLITVRADSATAPLLALLPTTDGVAPSAAERVYLIDPLGNLMMSYAPDAKPKGLLEDLKRLLGLSQVG